jgi:hypothetical protein
MTRWMVRWELALAGVVLVTQTAAAQTVRTSQGWPGIESPAAAAPARPAEKPKSETRVRKRAKTNAAAAAPA